MPPAVFGLPKHLEHSTITTQIEQPLFCSQITNVPISSAHSSQGGNFCAQGWTHLGIIEIFPVFSTCSLANACFLHREQKLSCHHASIPQLIPPRRVPIGLCSLLLVLINAHTVPQIKNKLHCLCTEGSQLKSSSRTHENKQCTRSGKGLI